MALIKCTECGHMISDKAMNCPKCGCPTKTETVQHQDNAPSNVAPVYDEEESHSNKWLYVVIAVLLAALAGGGYWWYSQSKGNQEVRQFVEQFVKAVETGDSMAIRFFYPDAEAADSLYIPSPELMISKMDGSNNYKVEWNKDVWLEISPQEKEGWTITSSQGLFAWPNDVMEFAKKTGQWKNGLTDKELFTRMDDKEFQKNLINEFCSNFKKKVMQKGPLFLLKGGSYVLDPWMIGITIVNSNDVQISGNDYKVTMKVWNQYLYNNNLDENEARSTLCVRGKDIVPNGSTTLSHTFEGAYEYPEDENVKIQWNINNQQLFDKYFVAKGDEYEKYIEERKNHR